MQVNSVNKRPLLGLVAVVLLAAAAALVLLLTHGTRSWFTGTGKTAPQSVMPVFEEQGIKQTASVRNGHLEVYNGNGWTPQFWTGVNLGATTPGHAPGELSPTKDDYLRWFGQIKEMHADVIRVYTILPPYFYEALAEFNGGRKDPLYVLHGIWAPEDHLIGSGGEGRDAYQEDTVAVFKKEIQDAVHAVHGNLNRKAKPGHASGKYDADISPYVLGWVVGTEWDPYAVKATDDAHPGLKPFQGTYFQANAEASPFESWLTQMLDTVAQEEMQYGWQHPVSFTNWVTTDPLKHPNEPAENEDMVSVDPMHISPREAWKAGYFASYHIYPYYPDLLRYEDKYQTYKDSSGEINPYAGYLHDLREYHKGIPLIVAEYGIPSSRGLAHYGPLNRNQGLHTEQEQGEIDAALYKSIYNENYDGAVLFSWQDEWFKITWNTLELDTPVARRPYWRNMLTNEEHFGVLAVEPGKSPEDMIVLDGKTEDWDRRKPVETKQYPGYTMSVSHDEAYLYLMLQNTQGDWKLGDNPLYLGFDTLNGGSTTADQAPGVGFSSGQEFVMKLQGAKNSALYVGSAYDYHSWLYGSQKKLMPWQESWAHAENGIFLPWKLPVNKGFVLPLTKERIPFEDVEIGQLHQGTTDPESPDFNNLADWFVSGPVIEVRVPWMMLGFTDPSQHKAWRYPYEAGALKFDDVKSVRVEPHWVHGTEGKEKQDPLAYKWDNWNKVDSHERLKKSYPILQSLFAEQGKKPPKDALHSPPAASAN